MLLAISRRFRWSVERYLPDAFILTALLTFVTLLLGIAITRQSPPQMLEHWYGGFWEFLPFAMQMTLILLTGYGLAMAPAVQALLSRIARIPKTPTAAVSMTVLVAAGASWLSWGVGLVLGPIFAREIGKRVRVDYPILVAAAYSGAIAALPAGLTITAPILVNTPGHFLEAEIGLIPLGDTVFSPTQITVAVLGVLGVLWAFRRMTPPEDEAYIVDRDLLDPRQPEPRAGTDDNSVAERLNDSRLINYALVACGFAWLGYWFLAHDGDLDLNILNFAFLMLGLALHGSLRRYAEVFGDGARAAAGIILQFPFYAGIMGMMAGSGLVVVIAQWLVSIATPATFGLLTMLSAGLINVFVPSAGGQWGIQGPVLIEAARQLDVPAAVAVNAFTVGDLWTNLLQPFLALPALGIAGLALKDIWGYCLVALFVVGAAGVVGVFLMPLLLGM